MRTSIRHWKIEICAYILVLTEKGYWYDYMSREATLRFTRKWWRADRKNVPSIPRNWIIEIYQSNAGGDPAAERRSSSDRCWSCRAWRRRIRTRGRFFSREIDPPGRREAAIGRTRSRGGAGGGEGDRCWSRRARRREGDGPEDALVLVRNRSRRSKDGQMLQPQKRKKKQSMETRATDSTATTTDQSTLSITEKSIRRSKGRHHHRDGDEPMGPAAAAVSHAKLGWIRTSEGHRPEIYS